MLNLLFSPGFSDAVIFLFLGVTAVRENLRWHTGFILWTCVLCLVVRFAGVLLLTALLNTARMKKISWREQFILSYGGKMTQGETRVKRTSKS